MRKLIFLVLSLISVSFALPGSSFSIYDLIKFVPRPHSLVKVNRDFAMDAVVIVTHRKGGYGSGFFVTKTGWIVTNYHVAKAFLKDRSVPIIKTIKGKKYRSKIYFLDEANDLALLKINNPGNKIEFPYLVLDSDGPDIGEKVRLLGSGGDEYFKSKDLIVLGLNLNYRWELLCTSGIRPGDSGGPIVDSGNRVVGVAAAYHTSKCITLAVPLYDLKKFIKNNGLDGKIKI